MQVAVLLRGEGFSACPGVQDFPFGDTGVRQEMLVGGIAQNGAEGDQFMADGAILYLLAGSRFSERRQYHLLCWTSLRRKRIRSSLSFVTSVRNAMSNSVSVRDL
jgi:hypothetical protein